MLAFRSFPLLVAAALLAVGCGNNAAVTAPAVPVVSLSASSLTFSSIVTGTTASQTVTLTNTGTGVLILAGISVTGTSSTSFSSSNNCGTQVGAGSSCIVTVSFAPAATGNYAATLTVADNAASSPQTVSLSGTALMPATPVLTISPSSLSFAQPALSAGTAQLVTLTNTGNALLTINSLRLTGASAASFKLSNNTCGSSLAAGASCTLGIAFAPYLSGPQTAALTVATNASPTNQSAALNATAGGTLSMNTINPLDWVISNGAIVLDYNPTSGHLIGVHLANSTDNLVDTASTHNGQPNGLYMDNVGVGSGLLTGSFVQTASYIDWWSTEPSSSTNPFTVTQHYIVTANDPGFHVYTTIAHSSTDIAGTIGQWQYAFRLNPSLFTETYTVSPSLGNLGPLDNPLAPPYVLGTTDPGRAVQDATVDLHGLPVGPFSRNFYTKYDYAGYEYLHHEHGIYGTQYGAWCVLPRSETLIGGPTKQDLFFTGNILMMEMLSSHLDVTLGWTPPQGVNSARLFGPFYFHFNTFSTALTSPASLYADAAQFAPNFDQLYDTDSTLLAANYAPSTGRGTVSAAIAGGGSTTPNVAWTVLSDPATNFQVSLNGLQYWANNTDSGGNVSLTGVAPGTYRLSSYVLGQWGELRQDGVTVTANNTTALTGLKFTPENFGTASPVWTIGTPDRSAHEYLHGHDAAGNDLKNYWGAYNYWADFASTAGQQVYYATAVGSTPATNDLSKLNYTNWQVFNPGLFGGVYNTADDTTDGYKYVLPSYVSSVTAKVPATTIHFATTASQLAQGSYAVLSVGLASAEASVTATLNGHPLTWHIINASDAGVRSGLSGYYQWIVFQWDTSQLSAAGADNVLTFGMSQPQGVQFDAMRFEITNTSSSPATTGWHDYEWLYGSQYTAANDSVPNNGK